MEIIGWLFIASPFVIWALWGLFILYCLGQPLTEEDVERVREGMRAGRF